MKTVKYYPSRVKAELKKYGKAYVAKKYGVAVLAKMTGTTVKAAQKSIKGTKGQDLDYVGTRADRDGKGRIYADGEENHSLHSHNVGPDKHKAGQGGIGNKKGTGLRVGSDYVPGPAPVRPKPKRSEGSMKNAPPPPKSGWKGPGVLSTFVEGGMRDLATTGGLKRQFNFNLSNDEDRAQGSEHDWANPTSISHLISSQLREASNAPADAWEQWAADKQGTTQITNREGSPFGHEITYTPDAGMEMEQDDMPMQSAATQLAQTNPMGAFGTDKVMYDLGEEPREEMVDDNSFSGWKMSGVVNMFANKAEQDEYYIADPGAKAYNESLGQAWNKAIADGIAPTQANADKIINIPMRQRYAQWFNASQETPQQNYLDPKTGMNFIPNPNYGKDPTAPGTPGEDDGLPKNYDPNAAQNAYNDSINSPGVIGSPEPYNPWAYGEGGEYNMRGPSAQTMGQATMEAMSLANAYFAPQRAELAYELGDMETDMRRLSANLGRQQDDPVLQAKLYKDASRAVRTLDIQQNTFAFQMVDARRKEELANWQFYDQMSQQEHQLRLANKQFYKNLDLQYSQYNLQNFAAQAQANAGLPGNPTAPPAENEEAGMDYGSAKSVAPTVGNNVYGKRY
jgi:hypothetical protein